MAEAAVPTILFTATWLTLRELNTALAVSVGAALVLLVVRLVQRSTVQFVVNALFGIGIAMIMGAGLRIAAIGGAILVMLMWATELPFVQTHMGPDGQMVRGATNPILDDHLTGAMTLIVLALTAAGTTWGLGTWWAKQPAVQKNHWLI